MSRSLLLGCLLFTLAVVAVVGDAAVVSSGRARVLVHKAVTPAAASMPHNFAASAPINVTLTLVNVGDAAARDVIVEDAWTGFEVTPAEAATTKFAEIEAGAEVSVSYFVTPKTEGGFASEAAKISYLATEEATVRTNGFSSSTTNLNVISAEEFDRLTDTHTTEWSVFSGLLAVVLLAPAFKWYELSSSFINKGVRRTKVQ